MNRNAFNKIMRGLKEAQAYREGNRQNYKVTVPTVDEDPDPTRSGFRTRNFVARNMETSRHPKLVNPERQRRSSS